VPSTPLTLPGNWVAVIYLSIKFLAAQILSASLGTR